MSTGATGVTPSPHYLSSTVTAHAPFNTQQQLPAGMCIMFIATLLYTTT